MATLKSGTGGSPLMWYVAGGVLVAIAIVLFMIDADPAFLFQSPLASLVIGGAGVGSAVIGYQRSRPVPLDD